ncbi:hypothetical protein C8Q75DRAFT_730734 [Abortiporus biennis]|nr:hypothetical protein C8Q75DRAFT_730734 [Abortiporus biennis]
MIQMLMFCEDREVPKSGDRGGSGLEYKDRSRALSTRGAVKKLATKAKNSNHRRSVALHSVIHNDTDDSDRRIKHGAVIWVQILWKRIDIYSPLKHGHNLVEGKIYAKIPSKVRGSILEKTRVRHEVVHFLAHIPINANIATSLTHNLNRYLKPRVDGGVIIQKVSTTRTPWYLYVEVELHIYVTSMYRTIGDPYYITWVLVEWPLVCKLHNALENGNDSEEEEYF